MERRRHGRFSWHMHFFKSSLTLAGALLVLVAAVPARAHAYEYVVTDYDLDIQYARRALDRFWGDPYATPGNDNRWYSAPGVSWLNELGGTRTACGDLEAGQANAKGFFYCNRDKVIYIDFSRLRAVHENWGLDGILAMLAHEYGHHLQNVLDIDNATSRQDELQADCFSGTALRWMQQGMPKLSRDELGDLAFATGGGSRENLRSHGSGADRERWWLHGWDQFDGDSYQFACLTVNFN